MFEDDSGIPTRWFSPPGKGTKHPTGKDLTYRTGTNENAGPFWIERMKEYAQEQYDAGLWDPFESAEETNPEGGNTP